MHRHTEIIMHLLTATKGSHRYRNVHVYGYIIHNSEPSRVPHWYGFAIRTIKMWICNPQSKIPN